MVQVGVVAVLIAYFCCNSVVVVVVLEVLKAVRVVALGATRVVSILIVVELVTVAGSIKSSDCSVIVSGVPRDEPLKFVVVQYD